MSKITLKVGIELIEYTEDELINKIHNLDFMMDAFLNILNPDVAKKYDFDFSKETYIEYAKELCKENNAVNKECLEDIFNLKK